MTKRKLRINGHSHLLPYPEEIPDFMKKKGIKFIKGYMFRYIYPLNKKAKKIMKNDSTMEWTRNYPKDKRAKNAQRRKTLYYC